MVGRERALEIVERAVAAVEADGAEALLMVQHDALTRFANSEIHQNVDVEGGTLRIRAVAGTREGWASVNQFDDESIRQAALRAREIAEVQPENPDFPGLADPSPYEDIENYDEATAEASPEMRAEAVRRVILQADAHGLNASGSLRTRASELCIANSSGVSGYSRCTDANLITVVLTDFTQDAGSGCSEAASVRVGDINSEEVGRRAVELCLATVNPGDVEPGEYDVVLAHSAVATCVGLLPMMGANGLACSEGRSYASGRLGHKVTSEKVTIVDDWRNPALPALPFDFEGTPRKAVRLIDKGIAAEVVYDRSAAKKEGIASTGHGVPGVAGGYPLHLAMQPGDSSVDDMITSIERGILVTRFNYTNPVHPVKTIITGMTKDGTFLIENGKVTRALRNLRFTDSMLGNVFGNIKSVSSDVKLFSAGVAFSIISVPAISARLNFVGSTV